jgi:ribonuclease HII
MPPDCQHELAFIAAGHTHIAGIDEVGRGCWAGPVVAAAVVLSDVVWHMPTLLAGLNDSKQLSATQRTALVQTIQRVSLGIGIGWVSAYDIDCFGILNATKLAMQQAVMCLPLIPDALLIDA